jgi:hypothetical protein
MEHLTPGLGKKFTLLIGKKLGLLTLTHQYHKNQPENIIFLAIHFLPGYPGTQSIPPPNLPEIARATECRWFFEKKSLKENQCILSISFKGTVPSEICAR